MAEERRRHARRHHRQAARRRIPLGRPQRHAQDQELPQRRLRGRRLPLLEKKKLVGSLLLGLYDDAGLLHHVGFTSTIKNSERADLTRKWRS
jgi:hypothetical protein